MSTRTEPTVAVMLLFCLLLPFTSAEGGRRRVLAVSRPSSALSIAFLGTTGVLDTGTLVSPDGIRRASTARTVLLRIGEPSPEPRGTATLRAYLETPDPRATIRVGGITLTTAPRVIQRHAPIGVAIAHRIDIEVPVTAPEGPLAATIGWEVTTD